MTLEEALSEIARLREALEGVLAVSSDRERFVFQGPRGFAKAEQIAKNALDVDARRIGSRIGRKPNG